MAIVLDKIVRCGDVALAAIAEHRMTRHVAARGIGVLGRKTPIAILAHRLGNATVVFGIDGFPISSADHRYSAQRQEFERRLRDASQF